MQGGGAYLCVLLIVNFGLDVQPYDPRGWRLASFEVGRTALTEDERVVNPKFGPDENVDSDHEGENHRDKECGINE